MKKKLSVITPSLNQGQFIEDCIISVENQNYEKVEHIIVDGGSHDNTVNILKKTKNVIWISEPDNGPANAINKGVKMSNGEVLVWLNADDFFERNVFFDIMEVFNNNNDVKILTSNITFVDEKKNLIVNTKSDNFNLYNLIHENADIVRQPSTFFHKDLFVRVNGVDENLKCAFDYDLFIKLFNIQEPFYLDMLVTYMRDYPNTISRKYVRRQGYEIIKTSLKNGGRLTDRIILYNFIRKVLGIKFKL